MLECKSISLNADLLSGDRQSTENEQVLGHWSLFLSFHTPNSHLLRVSFIPIT